MSTAQTPEGYISKDIISYPPYIQKSPKRSGISVIVSEGYVCDMILYHFFGRERYRTEVVNIIFFVILYHINIMAKKVILYHVYIILNKTENPSSPYPRALY
jgi:hypothetical protein